jgi:hypothetical protein
MSHPHDHYDGQDPLDHTHDHAHAHAHDHSDDITPALQNLLYDQIDFGAVNCLNESAPGAAVRVLQKPWAQRLDPAPELASDADEQLLLSVPFVPTPDHPRLNGLIDSHSFTGQVRLHSVLIRTSTAPCAPRTLRLHINRDDLDFGTAADLPATQTLELAQGNDVQEYPVRRALFNATRLLSLFVEDNWGAGEEEVSRISYVGFKGEFMRLNKEPVSVLYEAAANPADHKGIVGIARGVGSNIGGAGGGF